MRPPTSHIIKTDHGQINLKRPISLDLEIKNNSYIFQNEPIKTAETIQPLTRSLSNNIKSQITIDKPLCTRSLSNIDNHLPTKSPSDDYEKLISENNSKTKRRMSEIKRIFSKNEVHVGNYIKHKRLSSKFDSKAAPRFKSPQLKDLLQEDEVSTSPERYIRMYNIYV